MKRILIICILLTCIGIVFKAQTKYVYVPTITIHDTTELSKIDSIVIRSRLKKAKYIRLFFNNADDSLMRHHYDSIDINSTYYIAMFGNMVPPNKATKVFIDDKIVKYGSRYYVLPPNTPWKIKTQSTKKYEYSSDDILKFLEVRPILLERNTVGSLTQVSDTTMRYFYLTE